MQTPPIQLLIHGASGRMGRALLRLAAQRDDLAVVAAVSQRGLPIAEAGDVPVFKGDDWGKVPSFDVAVDFSLPGAFDSLLAHCVTHGKALLSGTTGLAPAQHAALATAGERIPVMWASNYSAGVAVLAALVRQAAAALPGWDADIVEVHHTLKQDAPSGTALTLGDAVRAGRGTAPHYTSLRAGDIVGEHTVQLSGQGERLELVHRATHRDIFARGALDAALRLAQLGPGQHDFGALLLADSRR